VPDESRIAAVASTLVSWSEFSSSCSFPIIASRYRMYQITAFVKGLPANSFVTNKKSAKTGATQLFWEWRDDGPSDLRHKEGRPFDDSQLPDSAIVFGNTGGTPGLDLNLPQPGPFGGSTDPGSREPHPSHRYMWHVRRMYEESQAADKAAAAEKAAAADKAAKAIRPTSAPGAPAPRTLE